MFFIDFKYITSMQGDAGSFITNILYIYGFILLRNVIFCGQYIVNGSPSHVHVQGNVYLWCRYRINYSFIFEFSPTTELRSREILLVCTCLTTIVVASMVSHLIFYFHGLNFVNPNSLANIVRQFMP